MSSVFIVILSFLAAIVLPWFIGVPLGLIGLAYVMWPRGSRERPLPDAAQTGPGDANGQ